jgi:hypothetical protein
MDQPLPRSPFSLVPEIQNHDALLQFSLALITWQQMGVRHAVIGMAHA